MTTLPLFVFWPIVQMAVLGISSWILIHLLAVMGVFLASAYPIWWFFFPRKTACLICQSKKENENCVFCQQNVTNTGGKYPKTFRSALLNAFLVLGLSLLSILIVAGESKVLAYFGFPPTPKTVTFTIPVKNQYLLGEIFPLKIQISGIAVPINTVQVDLSFDHNILEVVGTSTQDSFAQVFVQKEIDNNRGYTRLTGGLPSPGFSQHEGTFGTFYLRGKAPGVARVDFLPSSMVLANDGRGTNVIKELGTISYLILPEKASPEEEKLQSQFATVSGDETTNTQMLFYDEQKVLGTETGQPIAEPKKVSINPLDKLENLDQFILNLWPNLLGTH